MELYPMVSVFEKGQEAPVPYCEGISGRQNGQDERVATTADPLVGSEGIGCQASNGK
jgi:hypothetical protein